MLDIVKMKPVVDIHDLQRICDSVRIGIEQIGVYI